MLNWVIQSARCSVNVKYKLCSVVNFITFKGGDPSGELEKIKFSLAIYWF